MQPKDELVKLQELRNQLTHIELERDFLIKEIDRLTFKQQNSEVYSAPLSNSEKFELFMRLFANRTDLFPKAWTGKDGKTGWSPVCENEWKPLVCNKKITKCKGCSFKNYVSFDKKIVMEHFRGLIFAGMYAIDSKGNSKFLAVDFDEGEWLSDAIAFRNASISVGVSAVIERSRSGNGCHVWIFFEVKISARKVRGLGFLILEIATQTFGNRNFQSYDRFFPNQDEVPKVGFGNLIALPLCGMVRNAGNGVFIDDNAIPIADQWHVLKSIVLVSEKQLEDIFVEHRVEEFNVIKTRAEIVVKSNPVNSQRSEESEIIFDGRVVAVLKETLQIVALGLPQKIFNELKNLVTFVNPKFFENERLRKSNWDTSRYIVRGEMFENTLILPRGVLKKASEVVLNAGADWIFSDTRLEPKNLSFLIEMKCRLRSDQREALASLISNKSGILVAPTGTGKTVIGCALICELQMPTLVICHRKLIAEQWIERLQEFTNLSKKQIGLMCGARKKTTSIVDIALFQTLISQQNVEELMSKYSLIIIDECHHIPAFSYENLLSKIASKHILGLTATPKRKDGLHPIMEMQCGPVCHVIPEPTHKKKLNRSVLIRETNSDVVSISECEILSSIWEAITSNLARSKKIADDIVSLLRSHRKVLVISERKDHLCILYDIVTLLLPNIPAFLITGDLKIKPRKQAMAAVRHQLGLLEACVLFATGSLVGEGVDLPGLDSLVLAFPSSSREKLTQYLGRIERESEGKSSVIVIDYVDTNHPVTLSMAKKRAATFRALKYTNVVSLDNDVSSILW